MAERTVCVHLVPHLVEARQLRACTAVVIDVLRATTTIVYALAAGCLSVRPCALVEEAQALAATFPPGTALLGGERNGLPLPGFHLGNSPRDYAAKTCNAKTLILTTSNGTRAILHAQEAERILIASFVNFSAVCEELLRDSRPLHILCAGDSGEPCLEDTLLAGALIDFLCETLNVRLNDSARLAWDSFENHRQVLLGALQISHGGEHLKSIGYAEDIPLAAEVDKFTLAVECRREPLRLEVVGTGIVKRRWIK